jgi:metal-responsive CopG/Arc/MetJ family transcriptional regulator
MAAIARPERLQIMLTAEELQALDEWRFAKHMPSRAAAIRDLLRRGLSAEGVEVAEPGKHSATFGVLSKGSASTRSRSDAASGQRRSS